MAKNRALTSSPLRKAQSNQSARALYQGPIEVSLTENWGGLAQLLRSFAASLRQSGVPAQAQKILPAVLQHADDLGIARVLIADACQVSEGTLSRWAASKSKPHIVVAQVAVQEVAALALEKALEYENKVQKRQ